MIKKPIKRSSLVDEFRSDRGQTTQEPKPTPPRPRKKSFGTTPYESFMLKMAKFSEYVDDFKTRDLVYYFREIAEEAGHKYTIANIKKDMAIMKRLRESYSNRDICAMVEFLYHSDQDYLDKDRLSPNLLASQWVNTIYADTQLWLDDKYVPRGVTQVSKRTKSQHEWDNGGESDKAKIGVKL